MNWKHLIKRKMETVFPIPKLNKSCTKIKTIFIISLICMSCFNIFSFLMIRIFSIKLRTTDTDTTNFITKVAEWNLMQVVPKFEIYVCLFILWKYDKIYKLFKNLFQINSALENGEFKICTKYALAATYLFLLIFSSTLMIILEVIFYRLNFFALWCRYMPGILVNVYIAVNIFVIEMCAMQFFYVNENMNKTLNKRLTHRISAVLENDIYKRSNVTSIQDKFLMYDKIYNIVYDINNLGGFGLVIYFLITLTMIQSVTYSYLVSFGKIGHKGATSFYVEYWTVVFTLGLLVLTYKSHYLQSEADRTGTIVHQLVNVYPNVNEDVILHGLQLLNQKAQITAGGLFIVDLGIIGEITLACIIYVSVFIQIDNY